MHNSLQDRHNKQYSAKFNSCAGAGLLCSECFNIVLVTHKSLCTPSHELTYVYMKHSIIVFLPFLLAKLEQN